jgi:hypothetical protein
MPLASEIRSASIPSIVRQLRRLAGIPKKKMQASAVLPAAYQGISECLG